MTDFNTWTPRPGTYVHLRGDNRWQVPAGRYLMNAHSSPGSIGMKGSGHTFAVDVEELQAEHGRAIATPIDPADIERDRKAIALRTLAPLRSRTAQADVDGLGLFDHHRSPAML